jgi:hypothetical protein
MKAIFMSRWGVVTTSFLLLTVTFAVIGAGKDEPPWAWLSLPIRIEVNKLNKDKDSMPVQSRGAVGVAPWRVEKGDVQR